MKGGDKRLYEKPKRNGNAKANIYRLCKNLNGNEFTYKGSSRKANTERKLIMKLADYIANKNLAIATEIFDAKANTPEELLAVMERTKREADDLDDLISRYYNEKEYLADDERYLEEAREDLQRIMEFKNSDIGKMIERFITTGDQNVLVDIEREIEISNPFGVEIRLGFEEACKLAKGELMYGYPKKSHFHIGYIHKYYEFDNWDIDEDIAFEKKYIEDKETEIDSHWYEIEQLLEEHNELDDLPDSRWNLPTQARSIFY